MISESSRRLTQSVHNRDLSSFNDSATDLENLRTMDRLSPEEFTKISENIFGSLLGLPPNELIKLSEDNRFGNTFYYLSSTVNAGIMYMWEADQDPSRLIEQATEIYGRLEWPLEVLKLTYNTSLLRLTEAIKKGPEESVGEIRTVCHQYSRSARLLESIKKGTGPLQQESDVSNRNMYLLPASFVNAAAEANLNLAFALMRSPQSSPLDIDNAIWAAQLFLSRGEKILGEASVSEDYRKSLGFQRRVGANLSNEAYSYLLTAQGELGEEFSNSGLFAKQFKKFREAFESFLVIVKSDPKPKNNAKEEDKKRMPKDFNTEIQLRCLHGCVLLLKARQRFSGQSVEIQMEEQSFFNFLEKEGLVKEDYKEEEFGLPSDNELRSLIKAFKEEASSSAMPDDKAGVIKYNNWLSEVGV